MSAEETVMISKSELDQYKKFEDWIHEHLKINGLPCHSFRNKNPDFMVWYNANKDKKKREEQQAKLDAKIEVLLPMLQGVANPYEAGKAIVLTMSSAREYSLLIPKVAGTPAIDEDEEDEDDDC